VYLEQVLVSRLRPDSSRIQLRSAFADTTGKVADDLVLADGDEIRVFSRSTFRERPWITVTGAVRRSGRIPYREGMTLHDAMLLADGLTPDAAREYAEIARLPAPRPTGALAETIRVPVDSTGAASQPILLRAYDNVLFPRQGGYDLQRLVHLSGQVKAPGRYALTRKTERLSDLIERAGGLTDEAYAGGVEFYRRENIRAPASRNGPSDTLAGVEPLPPNLRARVGVDLLRVLKDPRFRDNLILASGDSIHIPEFDPVVTVQGAVNAPGPVAFTPGKNLDWYVKSAGGYAQAADKKRSYITQPNGHKETVTRRFLLSDDVPRPRPGARILIPERRAPEPGGNAAQVLGVIASVVASLTTIIVVLRN
jgi:protein involved in polysaccharide export with SLBB domain